MTSPRQGPPERPPYLWAGLLSVAILVLYVVTIAPSTQFWDTSEYMAAAKVLGIPHPPGNPLFVLMAHVWALLPLASSYALRLNLFAAVTSALASGLLFLVADRFLRDAMTAPRWARLATAAAGIIVGATSFTVWNQSVVNEKVYTLSLFSVALVLWIAVHWGDDAPGPHRDRWLWLIAFLLALTATNHLMGLLVIPAVIVYVLFTDATALVRWQVLAGIALVVVVGVSVWLFLPIRAAHFPAINEGEPTTWAALKSVLNREQYAKPPLTDRQAPFTAQLANYWQYFSWQFGHDWSNRARQILAVLFLGIGLLGGWRQWLRDRRGAYAMTSLVLTISVILVFYLNFKYGFSMYPEQQNVPREVRERDYFFIASFLIWGIWVALGLSVLMESVARFFAERLDAAASWQAALPLLAVAALPLAGNRQTASRAHEMLPRDFAVDLLESIEPYGVLITAGDNDTFPLWYAQEVEGVRRDVLLANQSLMNTDWHLRQLKRRPAYPFDSVHATLPYRGRSWPQPKAPALSLTFAEIDALPPGYQLAQRSVLQVGKVRAILDAGILERTDLAALQLIKDNLGNRPVYFSRTTGNYPDRMGLTPYLLGQGLARKLLPDSVVPSDTNAFIGGMGWVELPRTQTLLFEVYHPESAARARPQGWVDVPSEGILSLYWLMYAAWGEIAKAQLNDSTKRTARPDSTLVATRAKAEDIAKRILVNTSYGRRQTN
ncbi:MAG: DUF2723 domain-containing protein [Gemmatimonadetes bacterium]|nr:DUF2723 domain-containing protein [Gemmatimonadota bacterium]